MSKKNDKIVITGASSEIGVAITEELSKLNRPMVLHYSTNSERLKKWEERGAELVQADFTKEEEIEAFCQHAKGAQTLVYAAGRGDSGLLPQLKSETIRKTTMVNIVALTKVCQAVLPPMAVARNGVIVGISSIAAHKVFRGQSIYGGSKAYMESFLKAIAAEFGTKGVRANSVAPGAIAAGTLARLSYVKESELLQLNSSKKLGSPQDVATAVAFLCSPEASFINGSTLQVDGGHWRGV